MHFLSYCYYVKTFHNVNTCSAILQRDTISLEEFNGKMMLPATTTNIPRSTHKVSDILSHFK